jgi:tetratricopeptide (TPR) repeat protein
MNQAVRLTNEENQESAALFYNRAIVRFNLKDKKGAVSDYLKAISLTPEITRQQDRFGDRLDVLGNAAIVLKGLYSQKEVDSVTAVGYQQRAYALLEENNGQEREALNYINQALSLDNKSGKSYYTRARINYLQEEYSQALQDVNKAISLGQQEEEDGFYYLRGLIFYEMDLPQKAYQDFSKAITIDSKSPDYYYDRAFASAGLGEYKEAISDIDQALALDQESRFTYLLARSGFYNESHLYEKALADCDEVLGKMPDRAVVYYQRGVALSGLKRYNEAVADFTKALRIAPDFAEASDALREALRKLEK